MKKAFVLFASLGIFFSCAKEMVEEPASERETVNSTVTVQSLLNSDSPTKTSYETAENGDVVSSFIVGETDGDEIGLYDGKGDKVYKNKKFKATEKTTKGDKEWAVFTTTNTDLIDLIDVGDDIYCYYPYKASELEVIGATGTKAETSWDGMRGMVISKEQKMQSGSSDAPSYEHVGTYFPLVGKPTKVTGDENQKVIELSFSNPFALARLGIRNMTSSELKITGFDWSIPGTPMTGSFSVDLKHPNAVPQPVAESTNDVVSVVFTDEPSVAIGDLVCGVAIVAPCTQNKIVLTVHTDKGDYAREVTPSSIASYTYDKLSNYNIKIEDKDFVQTGDWKKVTSNEELTTGKFVLVYPNGTEYKLFSVEKTMTNAQSAAAMVKDMHSFAEVLPKRTELFQTCVNGNYQTVTSAVENAELLDIPDEIAAEVAMEVTTQGSTTNEGSVILKSTSVQNLDITKAYVKLEDDNSVTITSQVDAVDVKDILKTLRGHEITVTFATIADFAGKKVGMTDATISKALTAFDKLCVVAKDILEEKEFGTLMDIDRNTRVLDVFARYYDNAAPLSLAWDFNTAFGLIKPVGFYAANDGFSAHIPMPSSIWFDRLQESLHYGEGGTAGFVAYWQKFDQDYPKYAQFFGRDTLFGAAANKLVNGNYVGEELGELFTEVAKINWSSLGQTYQRYVDSLNGDPLEKVYLYKYVGE